MLTKIYSLYDCKAKAYLQPFYSQNKATALRAVEGAMSEGNQTFCRHPADYSLWEIGAFDDNTGLLEHGDSPEYVIQLIELVPEPEPMQLDMTDPDAAAKVRNLRHSLVQGGK